MRGRETPAAIRDHGSKKVKTGVKLQLVPNKAPDFKKVSASAQEPAASVTPLPAKDPAFVKSLAPTSATSAQLLDGQDRCVAAGSCADEGGATTLVQLSKRMPAAGGSQNYATQSDNEDTVRGRDQHQGSLYRRASGLSLVIRAVIESHSRPERLCVSGSESVLP